MSQAKDDIEVMVKGDTDKAWQLQSVQHPDRTAWFPKSQIHFPRRNIKTGQATATIPLWLLQSKGWV